MNSPAKPLNFVAHGKVKIKQNLHFPHVATQQVVPLIVHEFSSVAAEAPVVFVKNAETGTFQPVAILGFEAGENLFYGDPKWQGRYVPASITHHPFALVPSKENPNDLQMIIIETDEVMDSSEGEALFNDDGSESPFLTKRKEAIGQYYENMHITSAFVKYVNEKDLLVEQTLNVDINDKKHQLSGLHLVDEKKLNELSDEEFLEMRKRGYLSPIYAHMMSINQLNNLVSLKMKPE